MHNKIFFHKKYPSKVAPNIFLNPDITIEVYPNSEKKNWSNLIVIECKNHKRRIDNSIYREFIGNLSDYPRCGIRGIMISSVGFTQQVVTLAKKDNIALVVVSEQCDWDTIVWRKINNFEIEQFQHQVIIGETSTNHPVVYLGNRFITIPDLLQDCGLVMPKILTVPYMTEHEICVRVDNILKNSRLLNESPINRCLSAIAIEYNIDFVEMPKDCLGKCDFKEHIITINSTLSKHRQNFTIAHELGHIALHSSILEKLHSIEDWENEKNTIVSKSTHERMEYQANTFASFLLMPNVPFFKEVVKLFKEHQIKRLYHDYQPCNIHDCNTVIGALSTKFNVSKETVIVRMKRLKLYIDGNNYHSLNEHLKHNIY